MFLASRSQRSLVCVSPNDHTVPVAGAGPGVRGLGLLVLVLVLVLRLVLRMLVLVLVMGLVLGLVVIY